jgi:hypothetical protein
MNARIFPILTLAALTLTGCPWYGYNSYNPTPTCDTTSPVNLSVSRQYAKPGDNVTLVATLPYAQPGSDCAKIKTVQFYNNEALIGEASNTFSLIWTLKLGEKGIPADLAVLDLPIFAKGVYADGKFTALTQAQFLKFNQTAPVATPVP